MKNKTIFTGHNLILEFIYNAVVDNKKKTHKLPCGDVDIFLVTVFIKKNKNTSQFIPDYL